MASIRTARQPGEALRALARRTLEKLESELAAAAAGGGVHASRKRFKSARSLLRLIRLSLGEDEFAAADGRLRAASRLLAAARRAEALPDAVARLERRAPDAREALAELAALAAAEHGEHLSGAALAGAATEACVHVAAVREAARRWPLAGRDAQPFIAGLKDAYGRARRKLAEGLAAGDIAVLHEARKSVIHHLHHLDTLKPLWPRLIAVWVADLDALRRDLGDLHDLAELDALMAHRPAALSSDAARAAAQGAVAAERKRLLKRVRKRAGHLFAEPPRAFAGRIGAMWAAGRG
jgi:hypothetical protein